VVISLCSEAEGVRQQTGIPYRCDGG